MARGTILIVDDEPRDVGRFARAFEGWPIEVAATLQAAMDKVSSIGDLWLALLDVGLPDATEEEAGPNLGVFHLAGILRKRWPHAKVYVVTGSADVRLSGYAHLAGATYLNKFMCEPNLRAIAERLECRELASGAEKGEALARLRDVYRLTATELRVVALAMDGMRNPEIAEELGISRNTVKTHVRRILEKTGADDLSEVVRWVARWMVEPTHAIAR